MCSFSGKTRSVPSVNSEIRNGPSVDLAAYFSQDLVGVTSVVGVSSLADDVGLVGARVGLPVESGKPPMQPDRPVAIPVPMSFNEFRRDSQVVFTF